MNKMFGVVVLTSCLLSCTIRDKQPDALQHVASSYEKAEKLIAEENLELKDGDLVVRSGLDFSSQFVKNFNRTNKLYSHAGVVFFTDGYPFIYHIVPGDENPSQKMRLDSMKNFCNPRANAGFAIYRYDLTEKEITHYRQAVEQWQAQGVKFDSTFNLKDDDRMYCSEMLKKGLAKATDQRIVIGTTRPTTQEAHFFAEHLHLPFSYTSKLDVVAIDNLIVNPHCKPVRQIDFTSLK